MFEDLLRQTQLTITTMTTLLRDLVRSNWFRSVDVTLTIPAGSTSQYVRHGLNRAMTGAAVVGSSNPVPCYAGLPDDQAETFVLVRLFAASGTDTTIKLRVY